MKLLTTHEKIKLQITAFLFNTRADALRGEMYRALCLHVLSESDDPNSYEDIVKLVAYAIGPTIKVTDSLQTIVADELQKLVEAGEVIQENNLFSIDRSAVRSLPDTTEEDQLYKIICEEIQKAAISIAPLISPAQIEILTNFYLEICSLIAQEQVTYVARGLEIPSIKKDFDSILEIVEKRIDEYEIDKIIDTNEFILKVLVNPNDILSNFAYRLIQVHIIMQLLTWDPALEYLKNTVLKNKILYLDTSILFALMQKSHGLHNFLSSLLSASVRELGITLMVHERTITEYETVVRNKSQEFYQTHRHLRDIARICKKDGADPSDSLDDSIFVDFLMYHIDHIDLGSWQRYTNRITGEELQKLIREFSIRLDKQNAYIPQSKYNEIRDNMIRASQIQVTKGKRSFIKSDVIHDSQIYYLLMQIRKKTNDLSLGYNTYLLTLDGSLVHFAKLIGLPWTETYFIFPTQWYEMSFPFLRMRTNENPYLAKELTALAFSSAFPTLHTLIPLEIFGYVFDFGGTDLSIGSIHQIVETLIEKRIVNSLDPTNENQREREEAKLQLQRLIAEKVIEEKKLVEEEKKRVERLEEEASALESKKVDLEDGIQQKEQELQKLEEQESKKLQVLEEKERQITEKDRELQEIREKLTGMETHISKIDQDITKEKTSRQKRVIWGMTIIVYSLMIFGLFSFLSILAFPSLASIFAPQITVSTWTVLFGALLMIIGIILYSRKTSKILAFAFYFVGIVIPTGEILVKGNFQTWLWLIPIILSIVLFVLDYYLGKKSDK